MNPTYEHHRPYDGCDLYRGDALDVLPLLAEEGITADMVLSDPDTLSMGRRDRHPRDVECCTGHIQT